MRTPMQTDPWNLLVAAALLGAFATGGAPALAQGEPVALSDSPVTQLWAEISTLELLHGMQLTAAQAEALASAVSAVHELAVKQEARANAPEVVSILRELRAAALAGKRRPKALTDKLAAAQQAALDSVPEEPRPPGEHTDGPPAAPDDAATDPLWALASGMAAEQVGKLGPEQLAGLLRADAPDAAGNLLEEAEGMAGAPAADWDAWIKDAVDLLRAERPQPSAEGDAQLGVFLDRLRKLSAEEIAARGDALTTELRGLGQTRPDPEEQRKAAVERLAQELIYNRCLADCLAEYAKAVAK